MSNDYFQFRQFTVRQHRCAMKVGTDGTLLGAWAQVPTVGECHILDIGTGTGLIALMMAQRFPNAKVTGIDIDGEAVAQAQENVEASPFSKRINIWQADINNFKTDKLFDAIVSNPPYFPKDQSVSSPNEQRKIARQTDTLDFRALCHAAAKWLKPDGIFSVVIPSEAYTSLASEALLGCLYISRACHIKTTPKKNPKRILIEFRKHSVNKPDTTEEIIETFPGIRSHWYHTLTQEFYIR